MMEKDDALEDWRVVDHLFLGSGFGCILGVLSLDFSREAKFMALQFKYNY